MFKKLFEKIDQIKDEVLDNVNLNVEDVLDNVDMSMDDVKQKVKNKVDDTIYEKKTDVFSSMFDKLTDTVSTSAIYLAQVDKVVSEKKAKELGISSRELKGLTLEQIAEKYGMTVEQYQEKITEEAKQYDTANLATSVKNLKERSEIELKARENQANSLGMSVEEFDELTLQEQADKLNISLDELLSQRALQF